MSSRKAFTLIELLVAVAIVGLLSALVLVALNTQRGKARIARGQQLSSSLAHSLGSEAVGIWRFEEGSGSTAGDASGYGNNGSITNASFVSNQTLGGYALRFTGSGSFAQINQLNPSPNSSMTFQAWFNASNTGRNLIASSELTGFAFQLQTNGTQVWVEFQGEGTVYQSVTAGTITIGSWHHVAFVYDNQADKYFLFLDGLQIANGTYVSNGIKPIQGLWLGRGCSGGSCYFTGDIDEVYLFSQALSVSQIQQLALAP